MCLSFEQNYKFIRTCSVKQISPNISIIKQEDMKRTNCQINKIPAYVIFPGYWNRQLPVI